MSGGPIVSTGSLSQEIRLLEKRRGELLNEIDRINKSKSQEMGKYSEELALLKQQKQNELEELKILRQAYINLESKYRFLEEEMQSLTHLPTMREREAKIADEELKIKASHEQLDSRRETLIHDMDEFQSNLQIYYERLRKLEEREKKSAIDMTSNHKIS